MIGRFLENIDVLIGHEEDLQKGLGVAGPESVAISKPDPRAFPEMIDRVLERYPHIKIIATTSSRSPIPRTVTAGALWHGSMVRLGCLHRVSLMYTTG